MKSGVDVKSDNFRTYKKRSDSEFNHPYKNPYTVKQYKKLGENFIAIAYEHNNNSVFNILEKVDGKWKSLHKEEIPMKILLMPVSIAARCLKDSRTALAPS